MNSKLQEMYVKILKYNGKVRVYHYLHSIIVEVVYDKGIRRKVYHYRRREVS